MRSSESGKALSGNERCKINICCFSWNLHWSHYLLIAIISVLSIVVLLVLLPLFLSNSPSDTDDDPFSCSPVPYTGSMCLSELQAWQSCLPERGNVSQYDVLIPSDIDQKLAESQAEMLFIGLELVGPSRECQIEFREFWCLLLFSVCDGDSKRRLPSYELCTSLQTNTCADLIQFAATIPEYAVIVQNCNNFRLTEPPPCRNESKGNENRDFNVTCSKGFYYDESVLLCKPKCGEWTYLSPQADMALFVISCIGGVASIVICCTVLILAVLEYKRIFTFPSVLMIYATLIILPVSIIDLLSIVLPKSPICNSIDYIENIQFGAKSNTFCKLQANLFLYAVLVISLLWLFQTGTYFWVVIYPVHYRSIRTTGKLKIVHVIVVLVSFTLPVIPLVPAEFYNGVGISLFIGTRCVFLTIDLLIYGFILPIIIIIIIGSSVLVITAWHIGNVSICIQKKSTAGCSKIKSTEIKLVFMIITYLMLGLYTTLSANITLSNAGDHIHTLTEHFTCEGLGDESMECPRQIFGLLQRDSFLQMFVYIGFNLYPSIFFIFLISRSHGITCCIKKRDKDNNTTYPTSTTS